MYIKIKRAMDVFFSAILLMLGAIPLLIVALVVKLESKGPALFKQERLGMNGKVFKIYKFRSMVVGAEKQGSGVYSGKNDARVTKVGKIIRATSIEGDDIIRQTTKSLINKGFREVSPIHFYQGCNLISNELNTMAA